LNLTFHPVGDRAVATRFRANDGLQGYDNIVHGGVVAALLDAAMTHCLFHRGVRAVTGDLRVRFVTSILCDRTLDIKAWLLVSRPPLYRVRSEIAVDGQVAAWAEAKFMERRAPHDKLELEERDSGPHQGP
jgi:acyl-coenzyme A thioesterase PaaI-like protein